MLLGRYIGSRFLSPLKGLGGGGGGSIFPWLAPWATIFRPLRGLCSRGSCPPRNAILRREDSNSWSAPVPLSRTPCPESPVPCPDFLRNPVFPFVIRGKAHGHQCSDCGPLYVLHQHLAEI